MVFWVVVISVAVFVASFLRTHLVADVFTCVFALAALLMHHLIHNERKEVGVTLSLYAGVSVCFGSGLLHWKGKEFDGRIIFVVTLCTVFALYEMVRLVRKAIGGGDSSYENFMKALLLLVCAVLAVSQVIVAPLSAIPVIEKGYAVSLFMVLLPILVKEWRRDGKSLSQKKGTIYFVCFTLLAVCCAGIVEAAILRLQLNSADRDWLLAIVRRSKSDSLSASALRRLLELEDDEGKMGLLECYGRFLSEEERRRLTKDVGLRIAAPLEGEKKMEAVERVVRHLPDDVELLCLYAEILKEAGRREKSVQIAKIALEKDERCEAAWRIVIGDALERSMFDDAAQMSVQSGVVVDVRGDAAFGYVEALSEKGCWEMVEGVLRERRERKALLWRAAALIQAGEKEKAESLLEGLKGDEEVEWLLRREKAEEREIRNMCPRGVLCNYRVSAGLRVVGFQCFPEKLRQTETFLLKLVFQKMLPITESELKVQLGDKVIYRCTLEMSEKRLGEIFVKELKLWVPYATRVGDSELCLCYVRGKQIKSRVRLCSPVIEEAGLKRSEEGEELLGELVEKENLLVNGSFEKPLGIGWQMHPPPEGAWFFRDSSMKLDGSFSLCIELSDCRRGFWHIWQVIEVKEKESYEVKLAYKAVGWSNNHIMLLVRDAEREWFVLNRAESLLPSEGWKITVLRFKVPEGTHKVRISFYQYLPKDYNPREEKWSSSGAIWVDSVSLRRVK